MKKKQAKKTDKTEDKNKESVTQAREPLTIPHGNFVATIGEGFAGLFKGIPIGCKPSTFVHYGDIVNTEWIYQINIPLLWFI